MQANDLEAVRLSALSFAESVLRSNTTVQQGQPGLAPYTAEQLVESAKTIEEYILSE